VFPHTYLNDEIDPAKNLHLWSTASDLLHPPANLLT